VRTSGHAPTVDDLLERVRDAGGRVTTARRVVLEVLIDAGDDHLSADEVAARVHGSTPQVHLSTVYRTLESLEEMGILRQARLAGGPVSYHLAADEHHHAVCSQCGAVISLPASALAPVVRRLEREHGFVAEPRHLTIPGRCADCA
jgi:Fe2+ or Zn2+ uptake regulation protein